MPSEQEVAKEGINLGEINKVLTTKVEELTLYLIKEHQQNENQQEQINELKSQMAKLIK
jgi:hypothetical protein